MIAPGTGSQAARAVACAAAVLGGIALLSSPPPAFAQVDAKAEADHVAALRQCQQEADRDRKLACYDRVAGAFIAAVEGGDVRLVDRQEREKTRRGLFGFSLGNLFGGDGKEDDEPAELESLTSTITAVRQIDRKTYQIRIADGNALWQINEAPSRFIMPRVGEKVEFKRAALGSYFVRVGNQIGVKGKRVG